MCVYIGDIMCVCIYMCICVWGVCVWLCVVACAHMHAYTYTNIYVCMATRRHEHVYRQFGQQHNHDMQEHPT